MWNFACFEFESHKEKVVKNIIDEIKRISTFRIEIEGANNFNGG